MAHRYDLGTLRPPVRLADGRLRVDGTLTRSGVFVYRNADGSERREYRPPDEVFKADSMATFAMLPVTDDHPSEMLTAENAKAYSLGSTGENIRRIDDHMAAALMLFDASLIGKVEAGKSQLSCGYECEMDFTPGTTPEGERYDAVQRNIVGNHVAIVDVGRAGTAHLRMDSAAMVAAATTTKEDDEMEKKIDALTNTVTGLADAVAKLVTTIAAQPAAPAAKADAAPTTDAALAARVDKAEAERDAAKAALARKDAEVATAVAARVKLVSQAAPFLDEAVKIDALTDREIKVAVVKKLDGVDVDKDAAGKQRSDDYVTARFDAAVENAGDGTALEEARAVIKENHNDKGQSIDDARLAYERKMQNAWNTQKAGN